MPKVSFIDISHHNDNRITDPAAAQSIGLCGVIHKASEGTSYVDPTLLDHRAKAYSVGLPWATYHFLTGADPDAQMEHYLDVATPAQGERVVIDHEADASLSQLEQAVLYLVDARPDLQITVYSGHLIKDQLGDGTSDILTTFTSLWIAQYNNTGPSWPANTWPVWSAWQWSDQGVIPGVTGQVDVSEFNGDEAACLAWFGPAVTPAPTPEPTPDEAIPVVTLDIEMPEGVAVVVNVNGEPLK